MSAPSVVGRVTRIQLATVAVIVALAALAGALAGAVGLIRRDDATSLAVARVLVIEIAHHARDARLEDVVRDEIAEQAWLGHRIEVWRGPTRVGSDGTPDLLGPSSRPLDRCDGETLAGRSWRVCGLAADTGARVFVGTPVTPVVSAIVAVVTASAATALLAILAFAAVGRRIVRRALSPFERLGRRIGELDATRGGSRLGPGWDVVEAESLATSFDALLARIDDALSRERRFLFDASHELRTPLTHLRSRLELARAEAAGGAPVDDHLRAAVAACESLVRTTESVLALARSEVAPGETVDLCELVQGYLAEVRARDPSRAARVTVEGPDEALVRVDPTLAALALGNLVDNALKFSSGAVRVAIAEGEDVTLAVEDRGPGISDDEARRLFEPFFRGAAARSGVPGTGLGLALVRHVVTAYGGEVALERPDAGGLRVRVRLPRWRPHPRAASAS